MNDVPAPNCCAPSAYEPTTLEGEIQQVAQMLKALAEPMRLHILTLIAAADGEAVCACVFPAALGIAQPTASHHLKKLTDVGLLKREQRGKWAWFTLESSRYHGLRVFLDPLFASQPMVASSD